MVTYDTMYIYKSFLVWIIPSTYQSHIVISSIILSRTKSLRWNYSNSEAATQAPLRPSKTLCRGIFPTRRPDSTAGIYRSQRPGFAAPLMGFSPLGSKCEPNSVARISSSLRLNSVAENPPRRQNLQVPFGTNTHSGTIS